MVVRAENVARAQSGDEVEIYLNTRTKLKGLFMVYIFPVLGLLAGAVIGNSLSPQLGLNRDVGTVLLSFSGLALAFLLARILGTRMEANQELTPIVSRILRRASALS
jgi:sigma-E factor negative regulatory protein RseC